MSIRVTFLGTASGLPTARRFGQTIVLQGVGGTNDLHILDPGDGASSLLAHHKFDHTRIRSVFISHMHGDHHAGLIQLIKTSMHLNKTTPLTIFAPREGIAPLQHILKASYLIPSWLGFPIQWVDLTGCVGSPYALYSNTKLTVFLNDHLHSARVRLAAMNPTETPLHNYTFESYSMAVEGPFGRLVYAGNLNGPHGAAELEHFVQPCNMLIMELAHVHPAKLGTFLKGKQIDQTIITHFHPKWDKEDDETIHRLIAGNNRGRIMLANDGDTYRIG